MASGTHVEGLREAVKALEAAGVEIEELKEAMGRLAAEGADAVARHAPSRSGKLRASVRGNKAKGKAIVMAGRASVPYAGPVNYGWPKRNIRGRDFLAKADAEMGPRALQIFEDNINDIITSKGLD
jgi:hypothetical protein